MICAGMTCYEISGIFFLIDRPYHDFSVLVSFFTNLRELTLASFIIKSSSRALQNEATDDYYYRKQCHDNDIRRKIQCRTVDDRHSSQTEIFFIAAKLPLIF